MRDSKVCLRTLTNMNKGLRANLKEFLKKFQTSLSYESPFFPVETLSPSNLQHFFQKKISSFLPWINLKMIGLSLRKCNFFRLLCNPFGDFLFLWSSLLEKYSHDIKTSLCVFKNHLYLPMQTKTFPIPLYSNKTHRLPWFTRTHINHKSISESNEPLFLPINPSSE